MGKLSFCFEDEQRNRLLSCWKRPRDRETAAAYLLDVEWIVARWLQKQEQHPPTGVKEQITRTGDLCEKAQALLASLECLPQDIAELLNIFWLRQKYGERYFKMHEEAYRKDHENNTALRMAVIAGLQGFACGDAPETQTIVSEVSKLPPDFLQQAKVTIDFLRVVESASQKMATSIQGQKNWHNKEVEENLLYSLALLYEDHFGKLPSAANQRAGQPESASPFRKFLVELCSILGIKLGANIIREVLGALKRIHLEKARQKDSAQQLAVS